MEKLNLQTPDFTAENVEKLAALFPHCVTEATDENGNIVKKIDFDQLKQELATEIVEGPQERYRLDWPGKRQALVAANTPIAKTLRPCRDESTDFDDTKNIFIEGDNLDALKLLQESYLGKVKMIYIDPPYNTGKDFIYKDNFTKDKTAYEQETGQRDEDGGRLVANPDSNGRYHSDWLSMIYPRLRLARNLLRDDGVIFISIDDNEFANLRKACDEVFGSENNLTKSPTTLIWQGSGTTAGHFAKSHEYIVCYARNKDALPYFSLSDYGDNTSITDRAVKKITKANPASSITFNAGIDFKGNDATFESEIGGSEKQIIEGKMIFKNGKLAEPVTITAGWAMKEQIESWLAGHETYDTKGQKIIRFYFNSEGILWYEKERGTIHPKTVLDKAQVTTKSGGGELLDLLGINPFDFPKPTALLKYLISFTTKKDDIILDFFAGSATTAHAILEQNALEKDTRRRFIMVQLPEEIKADKQDALKFCSDLNLTQNIAEISKERIRRAAKKIREEHPDYNGDLGFRVFKIDSSNMKDVAFAPGAVKKDMFADLADNIKVDRTAEDLLFGVMLAWGLDLSLPVEKRQMDGHDVYFVDGNALAACFDSGLDEDFFKALAETSPLRTVFRDSGFASDSVKINAKQIFALKSPATDIKVI